VVDLSPAAERMGGWTRSQALGVPLARVLPLIDEGGVRIGVDAFASTDQFNSDRWHAETLDGTRAVDLQWRRFAGGGDGGVLTLRDAQERRAAAQAAHWAASHDPLTELPNRRAFDLALGRAYAEFRDGADNSALLMMDLDGFKAVNDGGGHEVGDRMLRAVAQVLRAQVRASDTAARLGGDEFAVLLAGCTEARAAAIGDAIRDAINALSVERDGRRYGVGVSIGVSSFGRGDEGADCPLRRADAAAYAAKRAGRNRVEVASRPQPAAVAVGSPAELHAEQHAEPHDPACTRGDCRGCAAAATCDTLRMSVRGRPA
jgi:diguanylate cyclase (GGDEF)-like protein